MTGLPAQHSMETISGITTGGFSNAKRRPEPGIVYHVAQPHLLPRPPAAARGRSFRRTNRITSPDAFRLCVAVCPLAPPASVPAVFARQSPPARDQVFATEWLAAVARFGRAVNVQELSAMSHQIAILHRTPPQAGSGVI